MMSFSDVYLFKMDKAINSIHLYEWINKQFNDFLFCNIFVKSLFFYDKKLKSVHYG
jgi:hypothetical protein